MSIHSRLNYAEECIGVLSDELAYYEDYLAEIEGINDDPEYENIDTYEIEQKISDIQEELEGLRFERYVMIQSGREW